jgi:hypothetical protein
LQNDRIQLPLWIKLLNDELEHIKAEQLDKKPTSVIQQTEISDEHG